MTTTVRYAAPDRVASGRGLTVDDPAPLSRLNALIGEADRVELAAGHYGGIAKLKISNGDCDIVARGDVVIHGGRARRPRPDLAYAHGLTPGWLPGMAKGRPAFDLLDGADRLAWHGLTFHDVGYGAWRVLGDVDGLQLHDTAAVNVRSLLDVRGHIDGLTVRRLSVDGHSKAAIRVRSGQRLRLAQVDLDGQWHTGDHGVGGIHLGAEGGTVTDVVLDDVRVARCVEDRGPDGYCQGDGLIFERGVDGFAVHGLVVRDCGDGGVDIKGRNGVLHQPYVAGCKRNFRLWTQTNDVEVIRGVSAWPRRWAGQGSTCHVHAAGPPSTRWPIGARIGGVQDLVVIDDDPRVAVFEAADGARLWPWWTGRPAIARHPDAPLTRGPDGAVQLLADRPPQAMALADLDRVDQLAVRV